jgi:hypothetical protein
MADLAPTATDSGAASRGEAGAAPDTLSSLKFSEKAHRYWLDGRPIPGVTTLLKGIPKPALVYWSARTVAEYVADNPDQIDALRAMGRGPMVNALKGVPWEARDRAAVRGTDVHALAEQLVHGETVDVPEHLAGYVEGYVAWLDRVQPEVVWTERPVINRQHWYAGTADALLRVDGRLLLADWKTSSGAYGEYACQVAMYANAEAYVDADWVERPMPAIDGCAVVHITDGATFQYDVTDVEAAYRDALHAAWVYRAGDRIKGYLRLVGEGPS